VAASLAKYYAATTNAAQQAALAEVDSHMSTIQGSALAAALIDVAGKLEGQAVNFNVSNLVAEGAVRLQSRTLAIGPTQNGFWRFGIVPGGFEGGSNVGNQTSGTPSPSNVHVISRYKAGFELTAFYDNQDTVLPFKRIDLSVSGVQRYLFTNELAYDQATKTSTTIAKGGRGYIQADLKMYIANTSAGRYGFKLSFTRGSLPPVYNSVSGLQFGVVVESADGDPKLAGKS